MKVRWFLICLMILTGSFAWAGYEIELISGDSFSNDMYNSVNLTEFNGKLYFAVQGNGYGELHYIDESGTGLVAGFPADGRINGTPLAVYNGKLYCRFCYNENINIGHLCSYDGSSFEIIENINSDDYGVHSLNTAKIYNGKMYISYTTSGHHYLSSYDETNITLIEEYDAPNYENRVVFDNKLLYFNDNGELRVFDGTNTTTISSPVNGESTMLYWQQEHNGILYMRYDCTDDIYRLAKFDGTAITLLNDPYCNGTGFRSDLICCNEKLYYYSRNADGSYDEEISCYNTLTESFENIIIEPDYQELVSLNSLNDQLYCLYQDSDGNYGFMHITGSTFSSVIIPDLEFNYLSNEGIVNFGNSLIFTRSHVNYDTYEIESSFSYFDGTDVNNIDNPEGDLGILYPLSVHNDELYLLFTVASSRFDSNHKVGICREVEDDPLPVELSSFTCSLYNGTPLLQWTTMSENNNSGWNVYRNTIEDMTFCIKVNPIIINGQGTTSETTSYSYLDEYSLNNGITYYYWLESIDYCGESDNYGPITLFIPEEGEETPEVPAASVLKQNIPNPFNPTTSISYDVAFPGKVNLSVYNSRGQLVKTLVNQYQDAGFYDITWQADNEPTGVYYLKMLSSNYAQTRKMLLLK